MTLGKILCPIYRYLVLFSCFILAACERTPTTGDADAYDAMRRGGVAKIAVAPDGTVLWGALYGGQTVFFASSGTAWNQRVGKISREVQVPSAP